MILTALILAIIALCSLPCWLAWQQTRANHAIARQALWALDDLKTLIVEREHEAGYVAGTSDERQVGAERAADLAATAVTVAAQAVLTASESSVYDPDDNLVARIKPTNAAEPADAAEGGSRV
jgi:hypothetical protein